MKNGQDFSLNYWNNAHPDLQFAHFKSNNLYDFVLTGLVPNSIAPRQTFRFQMPVETLFVQLNTAHNLTLCRDLILDTVWIDVETKRIDCTYRRAFAEEIEVKNVELRYIARNERRMLNKVYRYHHLYVIQHNKNRRYLNKKCAEIVYQTNFAMQIPHQLDFQWKNQS